MYRPVSNVLVATTAAMLLLEWWCSSLVRLVLLSNCPTKPTTLGIGHIHIFILTHICRVFPILLMTTKWQHLSHRPFLPTVSLLPCSANIQSFLASCISATTLYPLFSFHPLSIHSSFLFCNHFQNLTVIFDF